MKPSVVFAVLFSVLISFSFSTDILAQEKQGRKKRIAVLDFNDQTNNTRGGFRWYNYKHVGEGVMDMVITELVKTGQYSVMERSRIDAVIQEQGMQQSGLMTQETAVEVGKLLGVELAVFGNVTEFGYSEGKKDLRLRGLKLGLGKNTATVAIDLRVVSVTTGEILTAENVREENSATSVDVDTRRIDFSDQKSFDESVVGKAARGAVQKVVDIVGKDAERIPWQAKIAAVVGDKIYINSGSIDGVQVGETFTVFRPGQKLIDPDTGLELGTIDEEVGKIKVIDNTTADGKAAVCIIISGSDFQKGDVVKDQ